MDTLLKFLYVACRIFVFILFIFVYLARGFYTHWTVTEPFERKKKFSRLANWITGLCCRTFGVRVKVVNEPAKDAPGLIIGNHLGFIDILAIGSVRPLLFVTSQEMRETPLLGILTEMGGCIYVERRSRTSIQDELKNIIESLRQGFNICLYPEATSHNGEYVLPFKRTLLTSAAHAGVPIYPYVFNFRSVEGETFNFDNRDSVCWYGDISFLTAMVSAFALKYVEVEIKFLDSVTPAPDVDRALLADELHQQISREFVPVSGVPHASLNYHTS